MAFLSGLDLTTETGFVKPNATRLNRSDNARRSVQHLVTSTRQRMSKSELLGHCVILALIALWYVAVYYGTKALVAWMVS